MRKLALFACLLGAPLALAGPDAADTRVLDVDLFGPDGVFRAALVGDGGSRPADPAARALVAHLAAACGAGPACDAAALLGDNFYGLGFHGLVHPEGPMMRRRFHQRYAALALPFFAVLGNHEYLAPTPLASVRHTRRHPWRAALARAATGPTWIQPDRFFVARDSDALELFFLDTYPLTGADPVPDERARQLDWLRGYCAASPAPRRRIAFGHHPAATFGKYRDAPDELLSPETMDVLLACGVRHYASGHDHHLQRIDVTSAGGDTFHQIVSGKGGEVRGRYAFAEAGERSDGTRLRWGGVPWTATLLPDHSGDLRTNAYAGWADLRVTRGGGVSVTLEMVEVPE